MERAAALAERIDGAGPRRALGAWLAVLPSAGGGGAGRARAAYARARELAPREMRNRVAEAETLAVLLQDRALFDRLLGEVLAFDVESAPELRAGNDLARRRARELLARRDALF
jgi:predicted anti-sigma-YlaC factor YlaD